MKQGDELTGLSVNARDIGSLVQIAARASPAQVVGVAPPAVLAGNHVLDVKRRERLIFLGKPAVLAGIAGTLLHESTCGDIH
jgi:hypothetical protein